jgi:hypothetical protein
MAAVTASSYPIQLSVTPAERVPRWRALFSVFALIPHIIVMYVLLVVAGVCLLLTWFAILFTGKQPEGLAAMPRAMMRYSSRVSVYMLWLSGTYPPFTWEGDPADSGAVPDVRIDVQPQLEGRNRLTVFFRYFMVLPHALCLAALGIGVYVCVVIAFFAVLFTGKWPTGLRDYTIKVMRWGLRVQGYQMLMTDEYPPFELG